MKTNNYKFQFSCIDNGGKRQSFTISANDKKTAIDKALAKARKNAKGDILPTWTCKLITIF